MISEFDIGSFAVSAERHVYLILYAGTDVRHSAHRTRGGVPLHRGSAKQFYGRNASRGAVHRTGSPGGISRVVDYLERH